MNHSFLHNGFLIDYKVFGSGKKFMLCFHGMGRSADDFNVFEKKLGKQYTFVSINIFFHGNTKYPEERLFKNQPRKKEFAMLFQTLLQQLGTTRFSLMAYSLGGRLALSILEVLPEYIDRIILIAPDGLSIRPYETFTTHTKLGQMLSKWTINNPKQIFYTINRLRDMRLITEKQKKIVLIHMSTHEKRVLMRNAMSSLKFINPNLRRVTNLINKHQIDITLIFGKFDFIIPAKRGVSFLKNIKGKKQLHVIETSHNIFSDSAPEKLLDVLD